MIKHEPERKYIRKQPYKDRVVYQLLMPPSDSKNELYIASRDNVEELKAIRDEIVREQYTKQEILEMKEKRVWKKPVREPLVDKYIRRNRNGRYTVTNKRSYGTYATLEEAQEIRDQLVACDWDEDQVDGITVKRRNRCGIDRYIFKERGGKYSIKRMKMVDGKVKTVRYESSIPSLEEARQLRDEWEAINWDWDNIDLI